jgi:hypothetical protein
MAHLVEGSVRRRALIGVEPDSLLQCAQSGAQAGFVARSGVLVDHALLNGLVETRHGLPIDLFGSGFITLGQRLAQLAQGAAKMRCIAAVAGAAFLGLSGAFKRRKMVCHVCSLPSFLLSSLEEMFD